MSSVKDFQSFMTGDQQLLASSAGIVKNVSLTELYRDSPQGGMKGVPHPSVRQQRVALVLDGENCLDRLYGGYFPNWVCGGQWRHTMTFLSNLFGRLHQSNVQVVVYLNGALEPERFKEFSKAQKIFKSRSKNVMRHLAARGTPPPKAFWVPPTGLHSMLRLMLRALNVTVINSHEDHRLEVMGFCWENGYHGVMSDDGEFALFNPPKYFSAHALKLSMHFDVTTTEYGVDEVAKALDLNPNRFCLLASLLGNHILPGYELQEFHSRLAPPPPANDASATPSNGDKGEENKANKDKEKQQAAERKSQQFDRVIKAVINYIRALPSVDDYQTIARDVFGENTDVENDPRVGKLRDSVRYYLQGTKEGYSNHLTANSNPTTEKGGSAKKSGKAHQGTATASSGQDSKLVGGVVTTGCIRLPADQQAEEQRRRHQIKQGRKTSAGGGETSSGAKRSQAEIAERIALDLEQLDLDEVVARAAGDLEDDDDDLEGNREGEGERGGRKDENENKGGKNNSSSIVQALASGVEVAPSRDGKCPGEAHEAKSVGEKDEGPLRPIRIPDVQNEVKKTAAERHRLGQMSPYVNQVLNKGEIKLPVLLEGENFSQVPPAHDVFRPLRQNIYAVLFNLHHARFTKKSNDEAAKKAVKEAAILREKVEAMGDCEEEKAKTLDMLAKIDDKLAKQATSSQAESSGSNIEYTVREWHPYNGYEKPKCVDAQELRWAVPTVQRLWFGSTVEDKQKRLHAFMSIMRCDGTAAGALLVHANVPQPMLLMACVLRYLITSSLGVNGSPLIRKPELDAFLVTAFSPELRDDAFLDELVLENVTIRGVRLSVLFMQGIEMAMFANDACGAPIPFQVCLPWLFFDGKLFHANLARVSKARNVLDLCGGRIDIVHQVERMRGAIMEGLAGQSGQSGQSQASGGFGHQGYGGGGGLGRMQGFNGMGGRPGAAAGQLYNHKNGAQQKNKNRGGKKNKKNKKKDKSGGGVGGSGQTPNGDGVNEDGDDDVVYGNGDGTNGASEGETTFHTAVEE